MADNTDDLIDVTPDMIDAGMEEAREFPLGGNIRELVKSIYMAMEIERRDQGIPSPDAEPIFIAGRIECDLTVNDGAIYALVGDTTIAGTLKICRKGTLELRGHKLLVGCIDISEGGVNQVVIPGDDEHPAQTILQHASRQDHPSASTSSIFVPHKGWPIDMLPRTGRIG